MKSNYVIILSILIVIFLILNMIFLVLDIVNPLVFWVGLIIAAIFAYKILPKIKAK
jgi:hypothetical protein